MRGVMRSPGRRTWPVLGKPPAVSKGELQGMAIAKRRRFYVIGLRCQTPRTKLLHSSGLRFLFVITFRSRRPIPVLQRDEELALRQRSFGMRGLVLN